MASLKPAGKMNFPDLFLTVLIGDVSSCQVQHVGGRWRAIPLQLKFHLMPLGWQHRREAGTTEGYQGRLAGWRDGWSKQLDLSC